MKKVAAIVVGCAVLAVLAAVLTGVVLGLLVRHVVEDPDGLWISVEAPVEVELGETFTMIVHTTNRRTDRAIELGDLDVADTYLDGFTVLTVAPEPKSTQIDEFNACTTMRFATTLAPGASAEFRLELRADRVGRFRGQVDQFVGMQFVSAVVYTSVDR